MKRLARPWLRLWPLTAFLACLNPQPDDTPLAAPDAIRDDDRPMGAGSVGGPAAESPVFNLDEDGANPGEPPSPGNSSPDPVGADAGAPPAPDAGPPPDAGSGLD